MHEACRWPTQHEQDAQGPQQQSPLLAAASDLRGPLTAAASSQSSRKRIVPMVRTPLGIRHGGRAVVGAPTFPMGLAATGPPPQPRFERWVARGGGGGGRVVGAGTLLCRMAVLPPPPPGRARRRGWGGRQARGGGQLPFPSARRSCLDGPVKGEEVVGKGLLRRGTEDGEWLAAAVGVKEGWGVAGSCGRCVSLWVRAWGARQ